MREQRLLGGTIDALVTIAGAEPGEHTDVAGGHLPPLVFLHEGLGSVGLWRDFPERLREATGTGPTLVYSRHGYGRSDPPAMPRPVGYMHHEADVVLPEVLSETGMTRPLLIGHSDGASIALLFAGGGHDVAGLVLIAPHVFVEDLTIVAIEAARDAYGSTDLRLKLARHHSHVDVAFRGWNDVWLSPGFRTWNIEDRLAGVSCPVLIIQGEQDPYGTIAQLDAIEAGVSGPTTRILLPGIGHAPHLEAAEDTLRAIVAFHQSCT